MKMALVLMPTLVLTVRATGERIVEPNGTPAFSLRWGAAALDACWQKAGETCVSATWSAVITPDVQIME